MLATHSGRLERWLGKELVEELSTAMKDWYGPPIAVANVPGDIWACKGGDFRGRIAAGQMSPLVDYYEQRVRRIIREASRRQLYSLHAGFSSLDDLITEATGGGKRRDFVFQKNGATGTQTGQTTSEWHNGASPAAAAAPSGAPGGDAPDRTTTGAFPFNNPTGGDTQHFVGARVGSLANSSPTLATVMLYDRLFQVGITMNSTAAESVTGVPTRYQSSTRSDPNFAGGNFAFPEVRTALGLNAHNWTVCRYRDQDGNDTISFQSAAGIVGANASRIDLANPQWFMPLAAGDDGVKDLDQIQSDAAITSGAVNWVIGHPIAFMPLPAVTGLLENDGIVTAFNLVRIFDDAALALLNMFRDTNSATTLHGYFTTVSG